jgi:hypothetical protein
MLREQVAKLAQDVPSLRRYLVPLIKQAAQGPPAKWQEFLDAKYEGGSRKVTNPNLKTKDKYPKVTLWTALKNPHTMQQVLKEYHAWVGEPETPQPPPREPQPKPDPKQTPAAELFKDDPHKYFHQKFFAVFSFAKFEKDMREQGFALKDTDFQTDEDYRKEGLLFTFTLMQADPDAPDAPPIKIHIGLTDSVHDLGKAGPTMFVIKSEMQLKPGVKVEFRAFPEITGEPTADVRWLHLGAAEVLKQMKYKLKVESQLADKPVELKKPLEKVLP